MFLQFQLHHEFLGMMNGFNYEQKKNIDDGITQIVPGMSFIVYLGIKSYENNISITYFYYHTLIAKSKFSAHVELPDEVDWRARDFSFRNTSYFRNCFRSNFDIDLHFGCLQK